MRSNKPRLYVGLYARGGKLNTYHWALIAGPRTEGIDSRGFQFHAMEKMADSGKPYWCYQGVEVPLAATNMLLVRIAVAKIENLERVRDIVHTVPMRLEESGWTCVAWVREALEKLGGDGQTLGTRVADWAKIRDTATSYCDGKVAALRFDGKAKVPFDTTWPSTFDLMAEKEVIPRYARQFH